jgi:hypothetical protein
MRSFFLSFFTSSLCKALMMFLLRKHCKEGASVVIHFLGFHKKKEKIQKNIYIKKNIQKKSKK